MCFFFFYLPWGSAAGTAASTLGCSTGFSGGVGSWGAGWGCCGWGGCGCGGAAGCCSAAGARHVSLTTRDVGLSLQSWASREAWGRNMLQSQGKSLKVSVSMIFFFWRKKNAKPPRLENVAAAGKYYRFLQLKKNLCVFWKRPGKINLSAGCFWNSGLCFAGNHWNEFGQRGQDSKDDRRNRNRIRKIHNISIDWQLTQWF